MAQLNLTQNQIQYLQTLLYQRKWAINLQSIAAEQGSEEYQLNASIRSIFDSAMLEYGHIVSK